MAKNYYRNCFNKHDFGDKDKKQKVNSMIALAAGNRHKMPEYILSSAAEEYYQEIIKQFKPHNVEANCKNCPANKDCYFIKIQEITKENIIDIKLKAMENATKDENLNY
ncbi:MAG: hypothetical protein ACOC1K_04965 [Nanoarchaeota archaeon]